MLVDAIKKYDMDLVVCGHHQDFWSKLMSSARQLINTVHVDMLIVPLRDERRVSLTFLPGSASVCPADVCARSWWRRKRHQADILACRNKYQTGALS